MGRLFAGCFGCIALVATITVGLLGGELPESILTQALTSIAAFAVIGWVLGQVGDTVVRQSVEMNYRMRFEKLRERRNSSNA